jgi:hypothetical protein
LDQTTSGSNLASKSINSAGGKTRSSDMSQSGTLPEQAVNIEIKPKIASFLEIYIFL